MISGFIMIYYSFGKKVAPLKVVYKPYILKWYKQPDDWLHEAEIDGAYSVDYMIGEEEHLGKGYGTALVLALEQEIRENTQAKKIIVQLEPENLVSRKTLLSAGYFYDAKNDLYYKQL